jgi:hypothetical protein
MKKVGETEIKPFQIRIEQVRRTEVWFFFRVIVPPLIPNLHPSTKKR